MGPNARLDIVEYPGASGSAASYDVSVATPHRDDPTFVTNCARWPGFAAAERHAYKLRRQYPHRLPGASLIPLVLETGGRWHPSVPSLARRLARDYVSRAPGFSPSAVSAVVARWAARLSAILAHGHAAVLLDSGFPPPPGRDTQGCVADSSEVGIGQGAARLPMFLPEGHCSYELLVS